MKNMIIILIEEGKEKTEKRNMQNEEIKKQKVKKIENKRNYNYNEL